MFAVRTVSRLPIARIAGRYSSTFNGPVVSGPPRVRVPFAEKMVLASIMTTSFLAFPAWVLVHLQEYKGHQ